MKHIFLILVLCVSTLSAQAQEYGILAGIHNTDIDAPTGAPAVDTELGWRAGLVGKYELSDGVHFRSGILYVDRKFSVGTAGNNLDIKMAYLDIPVLFQFQMNETISLFAGPVIGINVSKKISGAASGELQDTKGLYLLAQAGVNFTFDQIGFDVYYERGFGEIADDSYEDYNIIGANFLFWF